MSEEAIAPIRMPMITRPVSVHMIAKIRAGIERGDRSPYLSANKQTNKQKKNTNNEHKNEGNADT